MLAALIVCGGAYATFERNKVWRDEESLWRDVTLKSPRNGRGLMNYGLTLMGKGDYRGALEYFRRALQFTPQYPFLFVNFAIAEDNLGETKLAEHHFRDALRFGPGFPDTYSFYARFLIKHGRQAEAQPLLRKAAELSPRDEMVRDLLTEASVFRAGRLISTRVFDSTGNATSMRRSPPRATRSNCDPVMPKRGTTSARPITVLVSLKKARARAGKRFDSSQDFVLTRNNLKFAEAHLSPGIAEPKPMNAFPRGDARQRATLIWLGAVTLLFRVRHYSSMERATEH